MTEIELGLNNLLRAINDYEASSEEYVYKQLLLDYLNDFKKNVDKNIFIFSLSENPDSLEQWRAYCMNGGVSLGFVDLSDNYGISAYGISYNFKVEDKNVSINDFGHFSLGYLLYKCKYTDINGYIDLSEFVSSTLFNDINENDNRKELLLGVLHSIINNEMCTIKHGSFKSEQEWRCVCNLSNADSDNIKLNENNKEFIELTINPHILINRISLSPHGQPLRRSNCAADGPHDVESY